MASAELNAKSEPKTIHRIEVLTGPERRRSTEDKERIVAESYSDHDSVNRIARRHGLLPQQLFSWRREARRTAVAPAFVAVALATGEADPPDTKPAAFPAKASRARSDRPKKKIGPAVTMMEIEAGGIRCGCCAAPTARRWRRSCERLR